MREVLWWALHPLQLSYIVKDGFLMIDSRTSVTEMRVEEMERKLDRVLESLERLDKASEMMAGARIAIPRLPVSPCFPRRSG